MDGIWFVYLILGAFPALIAFAAIYKYLEVRQASSWPSVPGRVVLSTTEARSVEAGGPNSSDTEVRNFAKVIFEYTIAGRTYRGNRVNVGEDMGDFQVAETLAKYPVGKDVTVYYNPNKRAEAILEREVPPGIWKAIIITVAVLVALIVGGVVGFQRLGAWVVTLDVPNAPFAAACIGFALLWSLVLLGFQRAEARARTWPMLDARVTSSEIRAFEKRETRDKGPDRWVTHYRAEILYEYEVNGVRYTGDTAKSGGVSSNVDTFAKRAAAKHPVGSSVKIRYNPDNPSESGVDRPFGAKWLLWLVPVTVLAIAVIAVRAG